MMQNPPTLAHRLSNHGHYEGNFQENDVIHYIQNYNLNICIILEQDLAQSISGISKEYCARFGDPSDRN